jgi:hypothetical protein
MANPIVSGNMCHQSTAKFLRIREKASERPVRRASRIPPAIVSTARGGSLFSLAIADSPFQNTRFAGLRRSGFAAKLAQGLGVPGYVMQQEVSSGVQLSDSQ